MRETAFKDHHGRGFPSGSDIIPSVEDRIEALEETVRGLNGDLSELTALVNGIRMHIPGAIYLPPRGGSRADRPVLPQEQEVAS